ncbi:MAG TPA: hypothetical protein VJY62_01640 [Bacteroidia bacterium]|nr:hypothetical protein [Bacteroidia bacterium]
MTFIIQQIMNNRTIFLFLSLAMILIQSCLSTAKLSEFPKSVTGFDFDKIANSKKTDKDHGWNVKTGFEYYLKTNVADDSVIVQAITGAMKSEGFKIEIADEDHGAILGERGMRANEWNSVAGVYYKKANEGYEMYVNCKITQDFTGGWREDRAKKIGDKICELLKNCLQSYSVNTTSSN